MKYYVVTPPGCRLWSVRGIINHRFVWVDDIKDAISFKTARDGWKFTEQADRGEGNHKWNRQIHNHYFTKRVVMSGAELIIREL